MSASPSASAVGLLPAANALILPRVPETYNAQDQREARRALELAMARLSASTNYARPIYATDYGVVGDGVTDDTAAMQVALDAGAVSKRVVYGADLVVLISGALAMSGPGLVFDASPHGDAGGPGLKMTGTGYTALTVTGTVNEFNVTVWGSGNTANGVLFQNIILSQISNVRVFKLDGFGVKVNKCYDSVFGCCSVEQCGSASEYAFSVNDDGDTTNQSAFVRIQSEKANTKAIYISPNTLNCLFGAIHSEQATPLAGTDTWVLGGARCTYNTVNITSLAPAANATLHINAGNTLFQSILAQGAIDVSMEANDTVTIVNPEFQGTSHVKTNQSGRIIIQGGVLANLATDAASLRVFGSHITTLTIGFANNPADATLARFHACDIDTLSSSSAVSAATFDDCKISEGNSLLRGKTVLIGGTTVTCAGTIAHSSGTLEVHDSRINAAISYTNAAPIRGFGAVFNGGITRGDAGLTDIVCDDGCVSIGTTTNVGVPTAGAHTVGERHKNLVPTSGGVTAWTCTVSATPGTWMVENTTGGSTLKTLTPGTHLSGGSFNGTADVTLDTDATSANTNSTIVARDGSGNFSASTITAALTGNATTATTLATPRKINGVNFDGSADITVPADASTLTGAALATNVIAASIATLVTGANSDVAIAPNSDSPTYNVVSLSGGVTNANHLGLMGGATGNPSLYIDVPTGGAFNFRVAVSNVASISTTGLLTTNATTLHATSVALTNGAGVGAGTITNAPSAGNPTKWVPISDNGTTRYIPTW